MLIVRIIALIIIFSAGEIGAAAATFVVNSTEMQADTNPGDGLCAAQTGYCTFSAALQEHNAHCGTNTIILPANIYTAAFEPHIYCGNLTITGAGASTTIIDAGNGVGLILNAGSVKLSGVTIRNGGQGGLMIWEDASLILIDSVVSDNTGVIGGGILNIGSLTIKNSSIIRNTAISGIGGGIANGGQLNISTSTISYNKAKNGGGIANVIVAHSSGTSAGSAIMTNVTISSNIALQSGGGILNAGTKPQGDIILYPVVEFTSCTISNNTAPEGGGLYSYVGDVYFRNSIIANSLQGGNCSGSTLFSIGHNISSDHTCQLSAVADKADTDPLLLPLMDNGASTQTHALSKGSPAIDSANPSVFPPIDQRGIFRPQGMKPDIGAYELVQPATIPTMSWWGMMLFMVIAAIGSIYYLAEETGWASESGSNLSP